MTAASNATKKTAPVRAAQAPAHRFTLRVPLADTSTEAWWLAQDDPSASVRSLIRDEIMRNGLTDTVNRPVTQLPRRGRPPLSDVYSGEHETDEIDTSRVAAPSAPEVAPAVTAPVTAPAPAPVTQSSPESEPAESGSPAQHAAPFQYDMDDIFGHNG
ncbi:MAG TPA: hypothetical protein VFU07_05085 [Candidatus Lumbricidophila sp.]|nr:hypothetical protein [Candidatus Lumbricidophila sp.]